MRQDRLREDHYGEALSLLKRLADRLEAFLDGPGRAQATVRLELGHVVSQGQEYRMVIQASAIGLKDYFLRAYVPAPGFPVMLDYLSEEPRSCKNEEKLSAALVAMIKNDQMMARLVAIRQTLSDKTPRGERVDVESFRRGAAVPAGRPRRAAPRALRQRRKPRRGPAAVRPRS